MQSSKLQVGGYKGIKTLLGEKNKSHKFNEVYKKNKIEI